MPLLIKTTLQAPIKVTVYRLSDRFRFIDESELRRLSSHRGSAYSTASVLSY